MWVNLCPHDIVIVISDTFKLVIAPSGTVARCESETIQLKKLESVPVTETTYKNIVGLPEPSDGVNYIVSKIVAERCPYRTDVYFPNENIRNDYGKVVGSASVTPSTVFQKRR